MPQEKTKNLIINIATGLIVLGVVIAGYFVFMKKEDSASTSGTPVVTENTTSDTVAVGAEVSRTVRELERLNSSVESFSLFFRAPEFQNLKSFSVGIPSETVGRANPFVVTEWKKKAQALEAASNKQSNGSFSGRAAQATVPVGQSSVPTELLGDFSGDSGL